MPTNYHFLGEYTYISMTKVDIWEHKKMDITATAIHEYIHSYLVRSTTYGNFMRGLEIANKVDDKFAKIRDILYSNEDEVQEATATLIENIYIWYEKGYSKAIDTINNLPREYKAYISKYRHIFDKEYILSIYNQYIKYINSVMKENEDNQKICEVLNKCLESIYDADVEKMALNVLYYLIIHSAELALNIDMRVIEEYWNKPGKLQKVICNKQSEEYHPTSRFRRYMKYVLPNKKGDKPRFDLRGIVKSPNSLDDRIIEEHEKCIIKQYQVNEEGVLIANRIRDYVNRPAPSLNNIPLLRKMSILYAQPYPLNVESGMYLFKNGFYLQYRNMEIDQLKKLIDFNKIERLHIHATTGKVEKYMYNVGISSIYNKNIQFDKALLLLGDIKVECIIPSRVRIAELLRNYEGVLYLTGCPRSEHLLDVELSSKKKLYVNPAAGLTYNCMEFINKYLEAKESEFIETKYGHIVVIKSERIIYFQCMLPNSQEVMNDIIEEGSIKIKKSEGVKQRSEILTPEEWENIEMFLQADFKATSTYSMHRNHQMI